MYAFFFSENEKTQKIISDVGDHIIMLVEVTLGLLEPSMIYYVRVYVKTSGKQQIVIIFSSHLLLEKLIAQINVYLVHIKCFSETGASGKFGSERNCLMLF